MTRTVLPLGIIRPSSSLFIPPTWTIFALSYPCPRPSLFLHFPLPEFNRQMVFPPIHQAILFRPAVCVSSLYPSSAVDLRLLFFQKIHKIELFKDASGLSGGAVGAGRRCRR